MYFILKKKKEKKKEGSKKEVNRELNKLTTETFA